MTPILALSEESLTFECDRRVFCCYVNVTLQLQIVRIANIPKFSLERVVFPGERLMFEALPDAKLEIYSREIHSRFVSCYHLRVTPMSED